VIVQEAIVIAQLPVLAAAAAARIARRARLPWAAALVARLTRSD
jgi:hypothetical protein